MSRVTPLEPGNRVQLPSEWTEALGLHDNVALERTPEGILIRPVAAVTWQQIFADKLPIGPPGPPLGKEDNVEVETDDLLF